MLYAIQPVPFPEADRQRQYEAVAAALAADTDAPITLLLGNPEPWAGLAVDALLLRPGGLVLLALTPSAGRLDLPTQPAAPWLLAGQPVATRAGAANPLAHYQAQLPAVQAWVAEQLGRSVTELPPSRGMAVFEAPLTFGPQVEWQLHQAAGADDFELLGGAGQLPDRLRALAATALLPEKELTDWAAYLLSSPPADAEALPPSDDQTPADYLLHQLRRLWHWLGAADVPPDPPYGPAPTRPDQQEQTRLHQLRHELQAELRQQRQEAAARETTYQQELLRLQQQVWQATPAADARQAQAAEAARQATQAELAARTQELDRRIQQLGQLIEQLQAAPTPASPTAPPPSSVPTRPAAAPTRPAMAPVRHTPNAAPTRAGRPGASVPPSAKPKLRPVERWTLLGVALVGAALGVWQVAHRRPAAPATERRVAVRRRAFTQAPSEEARPSPVYVVDSSLAPAASQPEAAPADDSSPADNLPVSNTAAQSAGFQPDSQRETPAAAPTLPDSTHREASPTP